MSIAECYFYAQNVLWRKTANGIFDGIKTEVKTMSETQNTQSANAQQTNQSGNGDATNNSGQNTNTQTTPTYTQEQLDSMVQAREQRATNSALKSFFAQQGMTEDEINQAINTYKTNREKNKPDVSAIQAQLEQSRKNELSAIISRQATLEAIKLGIEVNTIPYVLRLADFNAVADNDGKIDDQKLKLAINKVLEDVPQLKSKLDTQQNGFTKIGADGNNNKPQNEDEILKKAFGIK